MGHKPDFSDPVVCSIDRGGTNVKAFVNQISSHLLKEFKYALVWGVSSKHCPQRVGKEHMLLDEDVVQIVKAKIKHGDEGRGRFSTVRFLGPFCVAALPSAALSTEHNQMGRTGRTLHCSICNHRSQCSHDACMHGMGAMQVKKDNKDKKPLRS